MNGQTFLVLVFLICFVCLILFKVSWMKKMFLDFFKIIKRK